MLVTIQMLASNRPGVLDRVTGLIRRNGWNIDGLTAGDVGDEVTQICMTIRGVQVNTDLLGGHLAEMDGVLSWEECEPHSHMIREMVLLRIPKGISIPSELDSLRVIVKEGDLLFAEFTGSPEEVAAAIQIARTSGISCVRTGMAALRRKGMDEQ